MNDQFKLLYNSTFIFKNFNFVIEAANWFQYMWAVFKDKFVLRIFTSSNLQYVYLQIIDSVTADIMIC